jgi:hypothetical protein
MSYIFLTGAPGSRWSSVAANISSSKTIDSTDQSEERQYTHGVATHRGSYFDPGMEYGNWFNDISSRDDKQNEAEFNKPFKGILNKSKYRIIKSHTFATGLGYLHETWSYAKIVLVYRSNSSCFDWWKEAGGFDIKYPNYAWYKNDANMKKQIALQNKHIKAFMKKHKLKWNVEDNEQLSYALGIALPYGNPYQIYKENDLKVCVL